MQVLVARDSSIFTWKVPLAVQSGRCSPFVEGKMSCQGFVQCILKLINFLLTLVGAYMIVYSLWMFKEWSSVSPHDQGGPSSAPALLSSGIASLSGGDMSFLQSSEGLIVGQVARPLLKESLQLSDVPAPWYAIQSVLLTYSTMHLVFHGEWLTFSAHVFWLFRIVECAEVVCGFCCEKLRNEGFAHLIAWFLQVHLRILRCRGNNMLCLSDRPCCSWVEQQLLSFMRILPWNLWCRKVVFFILTFWYSHLGT